MNYLILISFLALGHCRPQDTIQRSRVEIEKQKIIELPNETEQSRSHSNDEEKKREAMTKDILQKIAEINLNHGLTPKTNRRPAFYSVHIPHQLQSQKPKQLPNFQFSNTPLSNPIFEYLQKENQNNVLTKQASYPNKDDDEDIPEGYAIKRKVTHQQTVFIPSYQQLPDPYYNQMYSSMPVNNQFDSTKGGQYGLVPINQLQQNYPLSEVNYSAKTKINGTQNKTQDEMILAKQNFLINNIKNIVSNSQGVPGMNTNLIGSYNPQSPYIVPQQQAPIYSHDPYNYLRVNPYINPYNPYIQPQNYYSPVSQPIPIQNQQFSDSYYANLQAEKEAESRKFLGPTQSLPSGRQASGPFSQYFPIVIKNPFQQMVQAFTSMIEYGPAADLCRRNHGDDNNYPIVEEAKHRSHSTRGSGKSIKFDDITEPILEIKDKNSETGVVIQNIEEKIDLSNDNEFYIEGLKIVDTNPHKQSTYKEKHNTQKPEPEDRQMEEEEEDVLIEEDKFFQKPARYPSKEEPTSGNGIFIQKLKVRKGGVAIAGPGGIATAGSGGPGSRVISVDPDVNLSEFVRNITRGVAMTRLGKLVAIGPIVYHDLGQN